MKFRTIRARLGTRALVRSVGSVALAAIVVGVAPAVANASPVPPTADTALLGSWVNTNAATRSVPQVLITPARNGSVLVDAFGACTPTLCEWGTVPAIVYGANVSAKTGASFQTKQRFLSARKEWSRITLFGSLTRSVTGAPLLVLREFTAFEDGSGRRNFQIIETFRHGDLRQKPAKSGLPATGYVRGAPPALNASARGHWINPNPNGGLVALDITGRTATPVVRGFGQCSPTPCNWGATKAITYGTSISSTVGNTLLAPYVFGFKNAQLVITYTRPVRGRERLTVALYSEFTDGSGRSNYVSTATLVRG